MFTNKCITLIISCLLFNLITTSLSGQEFQQLIITEDSISLNLCTAELNNLQAIGNFSNALFSVNSSQLKYKMTEKNLVKYHDPNDNIWNFPIIEAKSGKVNFMTIDSANYYPLFFITDDTLILRNMYDNSIRMYDYANRIFINKSPKMDQLINNVPLDFISYIFKFSKDKNKMALIDKNNGKIIQIFKTENNKINTHNILVDQYFKSWNCYNIQWLDKSNLLVYLIRENRKGNDYNYKQVVYNTEYNSTYNFVLPSGAENIDDFNNGFYITRSKTAKQNVFICTAVNNGKLYKLTPIYEIKAKNEQNRLTCNLSFISENKVMIRTNIDGESEVLHLWTNFRKFDCFSTLEINKLNTPIEKH